MLIQFFQSPVEVEVRISSILALYLLRVHARNSRNIRDKRSKVKLEIYSPKALANGLRTDTFVKRLGGAVHVDLKLALRCPRLVLALETR